MHIFIIIELIKDIDLRAFEFEIVDVLIEIFYEIQNMKFKIYENTKYRDNLESSWYFY